MLNAFPYSSKQLSIIETVIELCFMCRLENSWMLQKFQKKKKIIKCTTAHRVAFKVYTKCDSSALYKRMHVTFALHKCKMVLFIRRNNFTTSTKYVLWKQPCKCKYECMQKYRWMKVEYVEIFAQWNYADFAENLRNVLPEEYFKPRLWKD